tara:strand:- start:462 stop:971 length:510 start_codon:yes stop_codon:yes gene_type:complete
MKKNKCSYLIKSISINSIEEYQYLVDLHNKEPNNHIWGIEYTNKTSTHCDSNVESNSDLVIKSKINKSIICQYCNKQYSRNDSLKRHYITCKKKKEYDEKEKLLIEEEEIKRELEQLEEKELIEQNKLLKELVKQYKNEIQDFKQKHENLENKYNDLVDRITLIENNCI